MIKWNKKELDLIVNEAINERLHIAAMFLQEKIKEMMYIRPGKQSSKPGETPAVQKGNLRKSIKYIIDKQEFKATVGVDDELLQRLAGVSQNYGFYLEIGTNMIEARPYLRPALNSNIKEIKEIFGCDE